MICQEIKCPDYLTDEGEPAWCFRAGQPAQAEELNCPRVTGEGRAAKKGKGGCQWQRMN
jgi:hypothetical protein